VDGVGVIDNADTSLHDVEISGFQIDGNLRELPQSYANSGNGDHNAERLIDFRCDSGNFGSNISIHDMKLYDAYSDAIHLSFFNNVNVYNNFVSDCQHSGIYFISVVNGLTEGNKVFGITSDNLRYDNCVNNIFRYNTLYSFTGDSNGAYKGGQNGVQISDQGFSHGGGSNKPTTTTNVEGYGNVFSSDGLRDIWIDSAGKGVQNVYVHDNQGASINTDGTPVTEISFNNPPTVEMSEKIFSSIFDILNTNLSDSGYVNQSSMFNPDKTLMTKGATSAWIDVVGYTGEIKIGNDTYIPKPGNESALVASGTQTTRDRVVSQESTKKLTVGSDNNLTVDLEVKTTYNVPEKNKITILGKSINYTSYKKKSENTTFSKTFKAPLLFPAFNPPNVSVVDFNGSHAVVYVPELPGIVKIEYRYKNSTATEYRLIGYVGSATNGFKSTDYEVTENYLFDNSGMMSRGLDGLYITDKNFDLSKLNVTVVTPYDNFHISHFEYKVVEDDHLKFFKWGFVGILGYFFIFGRAIHKIIYSVVGKWI